MIVRFVVAAVGGDCSQKNWCVRFEPGPAAFSSGAPRTNRITATRHLAGSTLDVGGANPGASVSADLRRCKVGGS